LEIGDDRAAPNGHFDRLSASLEGRIEIGAYCIREWGKDECGRMNFWDADQN
jgi:hypothetical protein